MGMVQRKRHLAKALTYRVFGSAATAGIAYVATGDMRIGASVGIIDSVVKVGAYYLHERVWYRIRWGIRAEAGGPTRATSAAMPVQTAMPAQKELAVIMRAR